MRHTVLAAALAVLLSCGGPGPDRAGGDGGGGLNVLLLIVDTLRADHVHCYGYHREITPTIDSLAAEGTMWAYVQGQAAWTLPAIATIYSGLPERAHLAGMREERLYRLADELDVLPEILGRNGWETAGFYNVPVLGPGYGFDQGMDHVDVQGCRLAVDADVINSKFLAWLDGGRSGDGPFFAVLHYFDPHYPYDPPPQYQGLFTPADHPSTHWATAPSKMLLNANRLGRLTSEDYRRLEDLYDGEIAFVDREIGRMLAELRRRGLADSTLVILVADHGEEFAEHGGLLHGFSLHREETRVPLVISGPGFSGGGVDSTVVSQMDLLPTVLEVAGLEDETGPWSRWGVSLAGDPPADRVLPSSGFASDAETYTTVRQGHRRLFWDYESDRAVLFDLESDPMEQESLPPDSVLLEEAGLYWATPAVAIPAEVPGTQARVETLRDLGYCR
jgi:arylsulfatase